MYRFFTLFLLTFFIFQCNSTPKTTIDREAVDLTTFILVRHAEKESGQNPALNKTGQERAQHLTDMLSKMSISHIYSSDFRRTKETAQPVADQHQLEVMLYDPRQLPAFAEELKSKHIGETVLIVGHSNTTPTLAGLLAPGTEYPAFDESDYGNLIFVHRMATGATKVQFLRF